MIKFKKIKLNYQIVALVTWLVLLSPVLVLAKECYVDDGATGDKDGSKVNPYKTIIKALDKSCDKIKVDKGVYEEDIILEDGVELEGDGEETIVKGLVTMEDKTKLEDIYIQNGGIKIKNNSKATIDNVKVTGADIGILTKGNGKLTVINSKINNNRKGFYIQYGKDIEIKNNEIVDNNEEGIDIRANVDGIISNNQINNNGESGIEVIVGKSELTISNNSLKKNKSSGIAIQFYKEADNLGDLKISGNILRGNSKYGVDCKNPSGGDIGYNYWSRSIEFGYNKISQNKDGDFSSICKFNNSEIWQATKTTEEIKKIKDDLLKKKLKKETQKKKIEEKKSSLELLDAQLEKEREEKEKQQKRDQKIKEETEKLLLSNSDKYKKAEKENKKELQDYSKIKMFFFGPDKKIVAVLKKQSSEYKNTLQKAQDLADDIKTKNVKLYVQEQIKIKQEEYKKIQTIQKEYDNWFGLIPWFKNLF